MHSGALSREETERRIMRFLSAVSWVMRGGVLVEGFSGGNLPRLMGRQHRYGHVIQDEFDLPYLPEPNDKNALLALALMREGRGLNHPAYAFLSFYRVLEAAVPAKQRRGWITDHIDKIRDQRAKQALAALRASGVADVAVHLAESGRHAIAHAGKEPVIDPDNPSDIRRLSTELPIMAALAELAIEKELGVETSHTVWEKHLYELEGFKKIFGPELLDLIGKPAEGGVQRMVEIPMLRVELSRHEPYPPFSNLRPVGLAQNGTVVTLTTQSDDERFGFRCHLDFAAERLHFDFQHDISCADDGTAECAEGLAEIARFIRDYVGNGQLRILNAETGELISRKDAFIPLNMIPDFEGGTRDIQHWKDVAQRRRADTAPSTA
jgi:hypothetical protein